MIIRLSIIIISENIAGKKNIIISFIIIPLKDEYFKSIEKFHNIDIIKILVNRKTLLLY